MYVACTKEMNDWFWCYDYQSYQYCISCYFTNTVKKKIIIIKEMLFIDSKTVLCLLFTCNAKYLLMLHISMELEWGHAS